MWKIVPVAAVVLVALLAWLYLRRGPGASAHQNKKGVPPEKGVEIYLDLRKQALQLFEQKTNAAAVSGPADRLAILMDMPVSNGTATTAAYADGTASIYLSSGGGFIGGGQGHESIRKAGQNMLGPCR